MRRLVILGVGTGGTVMANHLRKRLPREEWEITVIDRNDEHYYQPGFLFIPFDFYTKKTSSSQNRSSCRKALNSLLPRSTGSTRAQTK